MSSKRSRDIIHNKLTYIARMSSTERFRGRSGSFVDIPLIPIKVHYFLAFGALGGVIPFLSVLIKSLGVNATAVGVIYTILPFTVLLAKPSFGVLVDYFKNIRYVIIALLTIIVTSYSCILLIPPIQPNASDVILECGGNHTTIALPNSFNPSCLAQQHTKSIMCEMKEDICNMSKTEIASNQKTFGVISVPEQNKSYLNFTLNFSKSSSNDGAETLRLSLEKLSMIPNDNASILCDKLLNYPSSITCPPNINGCISSSEESDADSPYKTYQFWTVLVLTIAGGTSAAAMFSLSDVACYEALGDRTDYYGKQRMWATISWGTIALLTGYFNDLKSLGSSTQNYSPGFFLMLAMAVLDISLLCTVIDLKKTSFSASIFRDVGNLFTSLEVIVFAVGVFIAGSFNGLLWTYEFWFLQSLGASQKLLGLAITVQCLAAEVPFFFFSGWIIQKLGHPLCLILTFVAFSLRYFLYSLLMNPWFVLPIEILHGWTFGTFYATMTSYARSKAPPGTEATMQGVLGGLFEGLGVATGSLLGGVGFDHMGGHKTFLCAAIVSIFCTLAFSVIMYSLKRRKRMLISAITTYKGYGTNSSDTLRNTTSNWSEFETFEWEQGIAKSTMPTKESLYEQV